MSCIATFGSSSEKIRVSRKRPGSNLMAQLLVDLLNVEEGRPGRLRRKRFEAKWEITDRDRLWVFASRLTRSGLGKPVAPVYRTLKGDLLLGNEDWVLVQQEGAQSPEGEEFKKIKQVRRDRATRTDREQNSIMAINRNGILDRLLDQTMRICLYGEKSSAAELVTKLLKPAL